MMCSERLNESVEMVELKDQTRKREKLLKCRRMWIILSPSHRLKEYQKIKGCAHVRAAQRVVASYT